MTELFTKLIRHSLAALAGVMAARGIHTDASDTASLIGALIVFAISVAWSWYRKTDETQEMPLVVRQLAAAAAQQLVAALAGYLQAQGSGVDAADPVAVVLFGSNLVVSKIARKDGVSANGNAALGQWTGLILLCGCMIGCTSAQWRAVGKSAALMAAQIALGQARGELARELAKPNPDKGKVLGLEFGLWMAEERLREVATRELPPPNPGGLGDPALPSNPSAKATVSVLLPPVEGK